MINECTFEGCSKPQASKTLCQGHYAQMRKGQKLRPLMVKGGAKVVNGTLTCVQCSEVKPVSEFNKAPGNATGYNLRCRTCRIRNRRKEKYGDIPDPTACEICGSDNNLHADHDHSCCSGIITCGKCFRGWLCSNCNTALGLMKDSVSNLESAIRYLKER